MPSAADTYKILIADDHDLVIDGYKSVIQTTAEFIVAGVAKNGHEVQTFFETQTCDIIILDINMPEMNGIQTIEYLHGKAPSLKILVISMLNSPLLVKKVIEPVCLVNKDHLLANLSKDSPNDNSKILSDVAKDSSEKVIT